MIDYFLFKIEYFDNNKKSLGSWNVAANTKMDALQRLKENWPEEYDDTLHEFATVEMTNLGSFADIVCIDEIIEIEKSK